LKGGESTVWKADRQKIEVRSSDKTSWIPTLQIILTAREHLKKKPSGGRKKAERGRFNSLKEKIWVEEELLA